MVSVDKAMELYCDALATEGFDPTAREVRLALLVARHALEMPKPATSREIYRSVKDKFWASGFGTLTPDVLRQLRLLGLWPPPHWPYDPERHHLDQSVRGLARDTDLKDGESPLNDTNEDTAGSSPCACS